MEKGGKGFALTKEKLPWKPNLKIKNKPKDQNKLG
jgi:hypothetical protein